MIPSSKPKPPTSSACIYARRSTRPCSASMRRPPFKPWIVSIPSYRSRRDAPNATASSTTATARSPCMRRSIPPLAASTAKPPPATPPGLRFPPPRPPLFVAAPKPRPCPRPRKTPPPPHQPRVRRLSPRGGRPVPASATDSHHPRQSLRAQNSGGPRVPPTTSASPVSLHAHLLVLAQPGRDLVRQDRTRGHRPRHLHLGFRLSSQTSPLHQRLPRQCSADPVKIPRPHPPHPQ